MKTDEIKKGQRVELCNPDYLATESSEDCIGVFHSSELEDPTMSVEGFYIKSI
jgi:hypothetical protein